MKSSLTEILSLDMLSSPALFAYACVWNNWQGNFGGGVYFCMEAPQSFSGFRSEDVRSRTITEVFEGLDCLGGEQGVVGG